MNKKNRAPAFERPYGIPMHHTVKIANKFLHIVILCGTAVLASCLQSNKYPPEPEIDFISASFNQSTNLLGNKVYAGLITFGFTDGDGDIGTPDGDTTKNMFVFEIGILNGEQQTPVYRSHGLPYITPSGQNKSLKGEIDVDVELLNPAGNPYPYDSVLFELYIKDRSGNSSNMITTPIIAL